jgi:hypothetical protein
VVGGGFGFVVGEPFAGLVVVVTAGSVVGVVAGVGGFWPSACDGVPIT